MTNRLPLTLSIAARLVSVFGSTPLGRAAYDAVVPRNSVGTLQLKRNAVTSSKLAPNTVRTGQVVDGSLLVQDFKPGQIPQGPKGDKGDRGPAGPAGLSNYQIVTATASVPANTVLASIQAQCPTGTRLLGGAQTAGLQLRGVSYATTIGTDDQLYSVIVDNSNTTPRTVNIQAVCATVSS